MINLKQLDYVLEYYHRGWKVRYCRMVGGTLRIDIMCKKDEFEPDRQLYFNKTMPSKPFFEGNMARVLHYIR